MIMPLSTAGTDTQAVEAPAIAPGAALSSPSDESRHYFLVALGEQVRKLRSRRGMTRKALAQATDVSERHLANLEYGLGNASILVLLQVAQALECSLAELLGDETTRSAEWLLIRDLLQDRDDASLRKARMAIASALANDPDASQSAPTIKTRIALIGLRGAGKSTLGALLAKDIGFPFVELSHEIEQLAGCSIAEIINLCGVNAYRRYESQALDAVTQNFEKVVLAAPGGIVSDPAAFNRLLRAFTTVWLSAAPEDHMSRVVAQGDLRPMAASREAMEDLRSILTVRTPFYSKADFKLDTHGLSVESSFQALRELVRTALHRVSVAP